MAYTVKNVSNSQLFNCYLTMNINNICRICLEKAGNLLPIFDPIKAPHFSILIMACASVQVIEGDGLPTYICPKCMSKLNNAFQFKSQCESSDAKLRQYFENLNNLPTVSELNNYIEIKKDNEVLYTVSADPNLIVPENAPVITNVTIHTIETSSENSQIQQPELQAVRIQPTECLQEIDKNPLPNLKLEFADFKNEDTDNLKADVLNLNLVSSVLTSTIATPTHNTPIITTVAISALTQQPLLAHEQITYDPIKGFLRRGKQQHQCDFCGKTFRTKPSLVHHIRIHTGERPYVCHLCDKRFINGGHLHTHMRTHTGEKNHVCAICPKAFATAQQLTKHTIAIHTSERPYGCTYCSKRFASSSNLSTHVKIHTGEKNYYCDKCTKAFSTKGQLFQHILVHTGEKAYLCEYCNKRFAQKAHLVRHLKMHKETI